MSNMRSWKIGDRIMFLRDGYYTDGHILEIRPFHEYLYANIGGYEVNLNSVEKFDLNKKYRFNLKRQKRDWIRAMNAKQRDFFAISDEVYQQAWNS